MRKAGHKTQSRWTAQMVLRGDCDDLDVGGFALPIDEGREVTAPSCIKNEQCPHEQQRGFLWKEQDYAFIRTSPPRGNGRDADRLDARVGHEPGLAL